MGKARGLRFSVAGVSVEFDSRLESPAFRLPEAYAPFETHDNGTDVQVGVEALESPPQSEGPPLFECSSWSIHRSGNRTLITTTHPLFRRVLSVAEADPSFSHYALRYNTRFLEWLRLRNGWPRGEGVVFSYPLEQLMLLPVLARKGSLLVHACGAVVDGRAFVLAGHSGDGKTTLSRLLAKEGVELLSDERVAIRKVKGRFMAYGTPWHGEGRVVSSSAYPLGGVFLLRKAARHGLRDTHPTRWAAELISRAIVPYYFPEVTRQILALVSELSFQTRLGELDFSLEEGVSGLLARAR